MPRKDFEQLVGEGFERLPQWVREKIKNVAVFVEDEPSDEDLRAQGIDPDAQDGETQETLLGLYKGTPLSERGEQYGIGMTMPDTITLYQLPIEDAADEEAGEGASDEEFFERVREIVADTLWHEFAHYFGMDERAVREREQQKEGVDNRA